MKAIRCELCGDNHLIKKDGVFECQSCGTQYTLEEARKLMVSGTVSIEGDVKVTQTDFTIRAGVLEKYNGSDINVIIPDNIVAIGANAFNGCIGMKSITIPESVFEIGDYAFDGCKSLDRIVFPKRMTSLGMCSFKNCSSLKSIVIPEGITIIPADVLSGCKSMKEPFRTAKN